MGSFVLISVHTNNACAVQPGMSYDARYTYILATITNRRMGETCYLEITNRSSIPHNYSKRALLLLNENRGKCANE